MDPKDLNECTPICSSPSVGSTVQLPSSNYSDSRSDSEFEKELQRLLDIESQCCKPPSHICSFDFDLKKREHHSYQICNEPSLQSSQSLESGSSEYQKFTKVVAWLAPYLQKSRGTSKVESSIILQDLLESDPNNQFILQGLSWIGYIFSLYNKSRERYDFLDAYNAITHECSLRATWRTSSSEALALYNDSRSSEDLGSSKRLALRAFLVQLNQIRILWCRHHPNYLVTLSFLAAFLLHCRDYDLAQTILENYIDDVQLYMGRNNHLSLKWLDLLSSVYASLQKTTLAIEMIDDLITRITQNRPDLKQHAEKLEHRRRIWMIETQKHLHSSTNPSDLYSDLPMFSIQSARQPQSSTDPTNPWPNPPLYLIQSAEQPQSEMQDQDSALGEDWVSDNGTLSPEDFECVHENGRSYSYAESELFCPFPCDLRQSKFQDLLTDRLIRFGGYSNIPSYAGARVLDFGAGCGRWIHDFSEYAPNATVEGIEDYPMLLHQNLSKSKYTVERIDCPRTLDTFNFVRACLQVPVLGADKLCQIMSDFLIPGGTAQLIEPVLPSNTKKIMEAPGLQDFVMSVAEDIQSRHVHLEFWFVRAWKPLFAF